MTWPLFATISVITLSVATLLGRVLMKEGKSDPISCAMVFQFMLGFFCLLLSLVFKKFTFPPVGFSVIRFGVSSFLWAGATVFGLWSIKKLSASEATIVGASSSVFTIFLGVLVLGETLGVAAIVGTLLTLVSIVIVSSEKLSFSSKEGVIYALLGSACAGSAVVNDAIILRTYEAFSYTTIMSFLPGVVLVILFSKHLHGLRKLLNKTTLSLMALFCFLYSVQAITFYLAYGAGAPIAQLSPFTKSSIVLTVILAAIFLNERKNMLKKSIAALLVFIGVALLS